MNDNEKLSHLKSILSDASKDGTVSDQSRDIALTLLDGLYRGTPAPVCPNVDFYDDGRILLTWGYFRSDAEIQTDGTVELFRRLAPTMSAVERDIRVECGISEDVNWFLFH